VFTLKIFVVGTMLERPTNRCSGPWTHKVLARGRAPSLHGRALCARALLRRRRAAAELRRYALLNAFAATFPSHPEGVR